MSTNAGWWDNPEQGKGDTPVIRHAPDNDNYHVPDVDMLSKMRGSMVGRFAVIPQANRDGTSKGFDATVAGPVHVDPDAPDGGVIFDPSSVRSKDLNQAIATSYFPHQAFYKLGTPAPLLGYGRGRMQYSQQMPEQPRVNPIMPGAYVAPKAADDGSQNIPAYVANGLGTMPASAYNPMYQAQEEQRMNPVPPLPPLLQPQQMTAPVAAPPHFSGQNQLQQTPQQYQPPYQQQPPPPQYAPQQYQPMPGMYQQPPPMDPNMLAMMQQMMSTMNGLTQQVAQVRGQQAHSQQLPVTGMSSVPLPTGPPSGLATVPDSYRQRQPGRTARDDDYDDESARPIRKAVSRNKQSQEIEEEDDTEEAQTPPRRSNSLIQQQRAAKQTVREYKETREEHPEHVIVGFETLNLPFVTGPIAVKPKKQVFVEIPNLGKHLTRYHEIVEGETCVVLIYDTRYEEGSEYLPPDMGEQEIKLHVPHLKKVFTVVSMGFTYSFGVFDHIVLLKHSVEPTD